MSARTSRRGAGSWEDAGSCGGERGPKQQPARREGRRQPARPARERRRPDRRICCVQNRASCVIRRRPQRTVSSVLRDGRPFRSPLSQRRSAPRRVSAPPQRRAPARTTTTPSTTTPSGRRPAAARTTRPSGSRGLQRTRARACSDSRRGCRTAWCGILVGSRPAARTAPAGRRGRLRDRACFDSRRGCRAAWESERMVLTWTKKI